MITILEQNINTPGWAKGMFIAIFIIIFYAIKSLFNKKNSRELNTREEEIFSVKISDKSKIGWISRIDYWITENNYQEAVKLCNYYTSYFGFDDDINLRIKKVNNFVNEK